jgi:hypothetical protein
VFSQVEGNLEYEATPLFKGCPTEKGTFEHMRMVEQVRDEY